MRNYVFIAIAVWALTGSTTLATELPAPDSGFDWNRAYAGIFGVTTGDPANGLAAGAGFDAGINARFVFLLAGLRAAITGTSNGAVDIASVEGTGRVGVLLNDNLLVYGTGGLEMGVVPDSQTAALVGAGVEFSVGSDTTIDARLAHAIPISGEPAREQLVLGANLHL